ncbi:sodium- and chloride-dependent GABA transporter ine [Megalops cyprinoides]|uniref:sodium- and chloride-dependent GABA transporter ine n=1 Tax=Megalops cyprinoides TaxID=118141 RepID=UPI00186530C0|nr:sodium- and chloride-dependent GABA transporter ine [Megalops cyprinoides]XP_036379972.1 sodium- and chloride-dependent GABA transporter ine [Megalops cyprinoides]XP_036379973.1 sodium- and chloride-dependent GABA transporter ine [Megalops cyprinoides]
MDGEVSRPTWSRQIEFTLAGIGCAVGLGNIWRFPYLCYRSGGGAFLVPYLLMLVVLGIPLLYMELTLGQYLRRGPVLALAKVCPLLKGVGLATVAISFIMCTYYNVIITWSLYYLFSSFQSPLPWENCNNTWSQPNCTDHTTNSSFSTTASQQFFNYKVLERTGGVEETGTMRWELFLLLLVAWILNYLCIFKGVKSTGKVVYFTALFPYIILVTLLINNVRLPGALTGIEFFIIPEWEKLKSLEVWVNAAAQIFNSIGIGFGSLMAMSSYNAFNNSVLKDTLTIAIVNSLTSILAGFVIFSAFGYMSHLQNIPVSNIAVDGPGLVFVVYPQAFVTMPVAPLWAVLFFFMLLCLGLDSQFAMVEVMVTSLLDSFGATILKYLKHTEFLVLVVCGTAFLLGIPHVMQVGIYVFQLMDHYTAIVSIMFLAFFEVVAVCWIYGVKRLSQNVEEMTGKKPSIFFIVCLTVISPLLVLIILVFSVIQFKPARYESYVYPPWAQGIGWIIALASIIWIPVGAVHTLWVLPGSFKQRLQKSITPFALDKDAKRPYYLEKQRGICSNVSVLSIDPLPVKAPVQTNL